MLDITPSAGLIKHEWRKHGTCSGLSPDDYFVLVRQAYRAEKLRRRFSPPIQDLGADSLSVVGRGSQMKEIRVCLDKNLAPRGCPELEARSCRHKNLSIPAPRP
ncbi:MAG: hypothetical protein GDA41_00945 [Rhodospirillales bacterium]|nr:hypothetical protein [Rhodospirillales bacterium]